MMDDVAVIGIGLRFPGNANSSEALWEILENGQSQWKEFPKDRLNIDGYYHPSGDRQGGISFKGAHFMDGNIAAFDAPFFSVSTEDAKAIDPQQRFLLEASYEALENAGIRKEDVAGSNTAVYVGSFVKDYEQICLRDPDWQPQYAATGNGIAIMANRISYAFDFHGPSVTVDTGCSGSLVSVHLAAQSLLSGESSLALAAGAGMIMTPNTIMPMTALNFLSPDGKCFTFDARANGYGRGEGIGVVVLKRVADAIRDNDPIRAVIRGSRVNQDGRTTGITLPSKEAQVANIRAAYASAGLDFSQTAYVECHGTGTPAGDWRELKAISETIGPSREAASPVIVGSIKPNIGHLEGAAGVAGLIKGVLVLERGKIPPNINFETPNPDVDFKEWRVQVPRQVMDWPKPGPRRVSVNCFGFGGTNAHVIMDEVTAYLQARRISENPITADTTGQTNGKDGICQMLRPNLFVFSSNEKSGIRRILDSQIPYIDSERSRVASNQLANYSYTLGCRRSMLEWRATIVASSTGELVSKMAKAEEGQFQRSAPDSAPRVCFVFCGQGAQWAQMGTDLMSFPVFRSSIEAASHYLKSTLLSSYSLLDELSRNNRDSRISKPKISQPATTAIQIAMVELLRDLSIFPTQVVGHSSGEIAAAFAAGALTREAAWRVAYFRGLCASEIPRMKPRDEEGGMIAVGMSEREAEDYLRNKPVRSVQVACVNSPRSTTLSGWASSIRGIAADLERQGIFHRVLPMRVGYHSYQMLRVARLYHQLLRGVVPSPNGSVAVFSSATGHLIASDGMDADYWTRNLVSKVQFLPAISEMLELPKNERPHVFLELSPTAALRSSINDILSGYDIEPKPAYLSMLNSKVGGVESVLEVIGELWMRGHPVDLKRVINPNPHERRLECLADLPPYPWNHTKSYWHESHLGRANRFREFPRQDLIGAPTADSIPFEPRWRGFLRVSEIPWIQDHQVQKTIVYPAAGMVSMVLEGAKQIAKDFSSLSGYELVNMRVEKAMIIPSTAHGLEMALNIRRGSAGHVDDEYSALDEFAIYSKQLDAPWEKHATGSLRFHFSHSNSNPDFFETHERRLAELEKSCTDKILPRQLYELLDTVGMNYGSLFQNMIELHRNNNSCVTRIRIADTKSKMPAKFEYPHLIHPATLDSLFQTLFAIDSKPMVPTFIASLFVSADIQSSFGAPSFHGYSTAERKGALGATAGAAMRQDQTGSWVLVKGLELSGIAGAKPEDGGFLPNHRNLCTKIIWKPDIASKEPDSCEELVELLAHKYAGLEILQVGGSCSDAFTLLDQLAAGRYNVPRLSRLSLANMDESENAKSSEKLQGTKLQSYVEMIKMNGSSQPMNDYHLIVIHPESSLEVDILRKHLKPGGWVVENHVHTGIALDRNMTSGGTTHASGNLIRIGQSVKSTQRFKAERISRAENRTGKADREIVLLHSESQEQDATAFVEALALAAAGSHLGIKVHPMTLAAIVKNTTPMTGKIVVSILDLGATPEKDGFVYTWGEPEFAAFHTMQTICKDVLWLTRGAHMDPQNPKAAPIVALGRTLMSEDPKKLFVTLDLYPGTKLLDATVSRIVTAVLSNTFSKEGGKPLETEYAEKNGELWIPRLMPVEGLNMMIEDSTTETELAQIPFSEYRASQSCKVLRLQIADPLLSPGSIYFKDTERPTLKANEVELRFVKSEMSFKDLEAAQGLEADDRMGIDVVGRITRIGHNVVGLSLDEEVVALVPRGGIRNVMSVNAGLVVPCSRGIALSWYVSAYYALIHTARISRNSRVLIQAGASCFGRAAITVCSIAGASVFATVVGDGKQQQRADLISAGVPDHCILEEDIDKFADAARLMAGGKGYDVVYNPTSQHRDKSVECVRPGGIVVHLDDRSTTGNAGPSLPANGVFIALDLARLIDEDVDLVSLLVEDTIQYLAGQWLDWSSPTHVNFDIGQAREALIHLSKAPYLSSVSLLGEADTALTVPVVRKESTRPLDEVVSPEKTYLLAGGLGGLGRSIAELLIAHGARHVAFLSRSGASTERARAFVEGFTLQDVNVHVFCADLCEGAALEAIIRDEVLKQMPPIAGVFQCAAVIHDAVFDNMTHDDWAKATRPKMVGSMNLVESIKSLGQDPFYIFLSSSAGVIGSRGQANYAAGNQFLDALARSLCLEGRHAVAIDLGPVLGAGMLTEDEATLDMLRANGFYGIRHEDFLKVIKHAITGETLPGISMPPQVTLGIGTGGLIRQNQPADPYWTRTAAYSYMNLVDMPPPDLTKGEAKNGGGQDIKTMLGQCGDDVQQAADIVCSGLMHMLAKAMNMLFEEMDEKRAANAYGVDSLVAVSVRNWVFSHCGVEVSVFEVLSDVTIADMALMIAQRFQSESG